MGAREMLRFHQHNFDIPLTDLSPNQILDQLRYLDVGLADEKDEKTGVSLGLTKKLATRRNELIEIILNALEEKCAV